jgi:hypothetical protein
MMHGVARMMHGSGKGHVTRVSAGAGYSLRVQLGHGHLHGTVRRHRDLERRDEIVLTISVNRTALVDRLIDARLLQPDKDHLQS